MSKMTHLFVLCPWKSSIYLMVVVEVPCSSELNNSVSRFTSKWFVENIHHHLVCFCFYQFKSNITKTQPPTFSWAPCSKPPLVPSPKMHWYALRFQVSVKQKTTPITFLGLPLKSNEIWIAGECTGTFELYQEARGAQCIHIDTKYRFR